MKPKEIIEAEMQIIRDCDMLLDIEQAIDYDEEDESGEDIS